MKANCIAAVLGAIVMTWGASARADGYLKAYGTVVTRGDRLDLAIAGEGNFLLRDRDRYLLVREGVFTVGSDYRIVHPATGYRLQRTGSDGEVFGFQTPGSANIRIPYDIPVPPKATTTVSFRGSLRADSYAPTTNIILAPGIQYTEDGCVAGASTLLGNLDQASGLAEGDSFGIAGTDRGGNPVSAGLEITPGATTLGDVLAAISNALPGSTASIGDGMIVVEDDTAGYSLTDLTLTYSGAGSFALPGYFEVQTAGGLLTHSTAIEIFDSQGSTHVLTGSFVRTDRVNLWDFVLTDITGNVEAITDRRVRGIKFGSNGAYAGLDGPVPDDASFELTFANGSPSVEIALDFGTPGKYDGLSQFGGSSTAAAYEQDGYRAGWLVSIRVRPDGLMFGGFTNGVYADIAQIAIVVIPEPATALLLALGGLALLKRRRTDAPRPVRRA